MGLFLGRGGGGFLVARHDMVCWRVLRFLHGCRSVKEKNGLWEMIANGHFSSITLKFLFCTIREEEEDCAPSM
jgi:hypothetical protein